MHKTNIIFIVSFILLTSTTLFFYIFYFNNNDHKLFMSSHSDKGIKLAERNAPYMHNIFPNDLKNDPHQSMNSPEACLTCHRMGGAEINGKIAKKVNHSIKTPYANCMDCHHEKK